MANADTLEGAGVNSGNALDAAKLQNNSETTKDKEQKKELPPVTPLGTNRRGISKAAQKEHSKPRPYHSWKINQQSSQVLMVQRYEENLRPPKISQKRTASCPTTPH